jgi:glycosyltransferase involved in cell wall biosynthesis/SAM-dependent methyltransferase/uncharacterized coiled-coil protein SlyX
VTDSRNEIEPLPWTGERYLPDVRGNIELEHVHRYLLASRLSSGKRVLDIACGEGYGSALLAQRAMSVVGVDIAAEAVAHANAKYKSRNLAFKMGSCAAIPLPDHSVDFVVSFETIEHHDQHDEMMREIKRVLVPCGVLMISSPDKLEYSDKPKYKNPYHVKELYRGEFESLLGAYFKNHHMSGQRIVYGSAIFSEDSSGSVSSFDINDKVLLPATGIGHALYLVAVASDSELPISESGFLEQPVDESDYARELVRQIHVHAQTVSERDGQIVSLNHAVAERDAQIASLNLAIGDRDGRITGLEQAAADRDRQFVSLNRVVADRDGEIAKLSHAVVERDGRIASLDHTVADHSGFITGLKHAVAERDGQIARVNHALAERERQMDLQGQRIQALTQSHSWRWTKPLRVMARYVRSGIRPLRVALDRSSARHSHLQQDSIRRIRLSPLFDQAFYARENPDVRAAGIEPATHYFLSGWREHRDPSERFSTRTYLQKHSDVAAAGINPLLHYIDHGQAEGRQVSGATNRSGDANRSVTSKAILAVASAQEVQLADHAVSARDTRGSISDTRLIDAEVEAIVKSGMFDTDYYLSMYPDIPAQTTDPIRHYCEFGWREGRNPSDDFNTRGYLNAYSDIQNADLNPFWHYVVAGALECRQAAPDSGSKFEDEIYFGRSTSDIQVVTYYSVPDWDGVQRAQKAGAGQRLLPNEDLGFYGVSDRGTLRKQALMAKRHSVCGWCFPLDAAHGPTESDPLSRFLTTRDVDIGFCVDISLRSAEIDQRSIACLEAALIDDRYLRIDGRPLLVMTLPIESSAYSAVLEAFNALIVNPHTSQPYRIARMRGLAHQTPSVAAQFKFEAVLDLPIDPVPGETGSFKPFDKNGADTVPYSVVVSQGIARIGAAGSPSVPVYRAITLGRDDSPLNPKRPLRYSRFHLKEYRRWLDAAIADTRAKHRPDRRLLFVNAWNDWNHGAVLEPDRLGGYGKLNETSRALLGLTSGLALPKVSIVVPNYNHAAYLPRRLESIYRQTYKNIEVLLLDDCSTDQSRAVLMEYADRYPECTKTLFNEKNSGGVFRQWAKGIKAASGDLIWIAESDDYCDEHFLEKLVRCFDDEAVMLAYSKIEFVRADESVVNDEFSHHVRDLPCRQKWKQSYVNTAHHEVGEALGIINTIPNASGAIFRRPLDMPLLDSEAWLSMAVVGDWVFYLHLIRGGKIAYSVETTNYFRRYEGSTAASTYHKEKFYRELGIAAQTVQLLYDVPENIIGKSRQRSKELYDHFCSSSDEEFAEWFDEKAIRAARTDRTPNLLVSTMSFQPGGAEILPIRITNELKKMGHSVLLLSVGLNEREDGVRRMLRNDVPVIETSDIEATKNVIRDFGIEVLNSHQWHVQKYPSVMSDVYHELKAHVASLHGMIEHGHAFGVTSEQLRVAHENVTTWVYTADKNLGPFIEHGLYEEDSLRFAKLPNGMEPPKIAAIPRIEMGIPDNAFVLCCVSRAIPDKGWAETIEAIALARELSGRDIRLILVGNGPVHDEYRRAGVPDFVYLAGFSENSVGYYAAADMGIMLTRFRSESFPLTIVDCLFAGKPYISCDVGEIRNMLTEEDEVAGAVVSLNDWQVPIAQVAEIIAAYSTDIRKYSDAIAVVPKLATRYRIDNVVERYVEIFRSTLVSRAMPKRIDTHATTF